MKTEEDFNKMYKSEINFKNFVDFMKIFRKLFIVNFYPDAPFESCFPFLDAMTEILKTFSTNDYLFQNKNIFEGTRVLYYLNFYS